MARGNDVACREAGDTKSTLIAASWPSYTLLSMVASPAFNPHEINTLTSTSFKTSQSVSYTVKKQKKNSNTYFQCFVHPML